MSATGLRARHTAASLRLMRWSGTLRAGALLAASACVVGVMAGPASAQGPRTVRVPGTNSAGGPILSGNGQVVAYTDYGSSTQLSVQSLATGKTSRVTTGLHGAAGNRPSFLLSISADGRYLLFSSEASNLVPGDTNNRFDIFLRDVKMGRTTRVSVSSSGAQLADGSLSGGMSPDAQFAVFTSNSPATPGQSTSLSAMVYRRNLHTGAVQLVSKSANGQPVDGDSSSPQISNGGRYVVFTSRASNLVAGHTYSDADIYVRDMNTGTTRIVSVTPTGAEPNEYSDYASISNDGHFVAFQSLASNIVPGDTATCSDPDNGPYNCTDVFVRNMVAGTTVRASVSSAGAQGNRGGDGAAISGDGRFVAFSSASTNLVPGDRNNKNDIFRYDVQTRTTQRVSVNSAGKQFSGDAVNLLDAPQVLSTSGAYVVFDVPGVAGSIPNGVYIRGPLG